VSGTEATRGTIQSTTRPLWRRLLGAPEAGLVLVILLLGGLLAAFAGSKTSQVDLALPAGATAVRQQGVWVVTTDDAAFLASLRKTLQASEEGQLRVKAGAETATFEAGKPRYIEGSEGQPSVMKVDGVRENRFLNLANLTMLANNASTIAIMAVGMTLIIAMGGIDLSIGMVWALSAFVGIFVFKYPWDNGLPSLAFKGHAWPVVAAAVWAVASAAIVLGLRARTRKVGPSPSTTAWTTASVVSGSGAVLFVVGVALFALSAAVFADQTREPVAMSMPVALLVGLGVCAATGAVCGLINGSLTVGLNVHPFIITLGMMAVLEGFLFVLSGSQSLVGVPAGFGDDFFKARFAGVYPVPVFCMVLTTVVGTIVLKRMVLGRRTLAIGDNEKAAMYAGIPVGRTKIMVYTVAGALAGLSAAVNLGYWQSASPSAGKGLELQVIAATVIGGASLAGGRGSAIGAVLGAILIEMINNGMVMLEVDSNYNKIVMGVAIVLAVVIDKTKTKLHTRRG
jgi:ribose/xylose/arabinose/galactoside ABC-type transport system permease subunit